MRLPQLSENELLEAIPELEWLGTPKNGGQKLVFPCRIGGNPFALKVLLARSSPLANLDSDDLAYEPVDEVTARARREVAIMNSCDSPYLVKLGPLGLAERQIAGQHVIFYTEEWIDGEDIATLLRRPTLISFYDVAQLGVQVAEAIKVIWNFKKIHRDIKPGNIMQRQVTGEYVLLDLGLAFDLQDISLTGHGYVPGTIIYLSPEQTEFNQKRQLDFRSDLFALGIVMYEVLTRRHPFWQPGMSSQQAVANMLMNVPAAPSQLRPGTPDELTKIIMRLLAKRPHLRYRSCDQLIDNLTAVAKDLI